MKVNACNYRQHERAKGIVTL